MQAGKQLCPPPPLLTLCLSLALHMSLQLFTLSLCVSPASRLSGLAVLPAEGITAVPSVSPYSPHPRPRTREATVATWKTSPTPRSQDREDRSTQDMAPTCLASSALLMCNRDEPLLEQLPVWPGRPACPVHSQAAQPWPWGKTPEPLLATSRGHSRVSGRLMSKLMSTVSESG